jgi:hypothetical protein
VSTAATSSALSVQSSRLGDIQRQTLEVGRRLDYRGYSKHDALNARWLNTVVGDSRTLRLVAIQAVMRSPFHIRPLLGVRGTRNAKGLALFGRAWLARHRLTGEEEAASEARALLDWLIEHPSAGFPWPCWGYPYPWQDVGFLAPRGYPNRVVTSFVVQALLDGYEAFGAARWLEAAEGAVRFLLEAPKTLYADEHRRCVSYVPSDDIDWIVLDVPALAGAAVARLAAIREREDLIAEAGRLIRYVVSKQTEYGAWYYAEPPSASHITHDNYHTGFILDSILCYERASGNGEFAEAYHRGLAFYRHHLFESDGAPRFMSDRKRPYDIHGAAQGVITFSLAQKATGEGIVTAERVLSWTLDQLWDPRTGWFYYQKRRFFRTRVRLLRWCQAWMAHALGVYLESSRGVG